MPAAFFVVRATVTDPAKRKAFDRWYAKEHLPDATKAFGVKRAWRSWSVSDPAVHVASYEFPDRTALGNVMFGLGRGARDEAMRYLRHTGLSEADANKYPHQLSGGMQQRVAIAQALIMKPPVLLMDEAFSALDPGTRRGMQKLMRELWRESGTTVVFVTHNTREAVCLGTRIIALSKDGDGTRGSSIALDLAVPDLDFDSEESDIGDLVREVESASVRERPLVYN